MYFYIRRYLISRKEKRYKSEYPKYVLEAENADNEKRYFRNKVTMFELNEHNELLIKKRPKKSIRNKYEIYFIPLVKNL